MRFWEYILVSSSLVTEALCWGDVGHRTVGYLAKKYLTDSANELFEGILANPNGWDFSDAATWADTVRNRRPYTSTWHYVDARDSPPTLCGLKYPADCSAQGANGCVITAINNQTSLFLSPDSSEITTKEALMYLMHFIGDLHQPLHVEDKARGGNDIKPVRFGGVATLNLHTVWDTTIPHKMRSLTGTLTDAQERAAASAWAEELFELNAERGVAAETECSDVLTPDKCALRWANKSNEWICKYVLKESEEWFKDRDNNLGEEYYDGAKPIVNELIGLAGARLGAWMNAMAVIVLERVAMGPELSPKLSSDEEREDL
ncbi:S1/P1 nuclease [Rhexocercosporidium sp. MPI-PUGE-AT-0058]|nr:S1/P1 nuclease [Rhexocercosporidium sp. MPI-PUGE-AT-0058]